MDDASETPKSLASGPLGPAFHAWSNHARAAEDLVYLAREGLARLLVMPEIFRTLEEGQKVIDRAEWKASRAAREIKAGFPTLHAHTLLGLCGALECLVEDIFIARIAADQSLLAGELFAKIKLPLPVIYGSEDRDRHVAIMTAATRETSADLAVGATKFERLLELVGLSGPVPQVLRVAIFNAQQIRNVWAHRGGVADQRFVKDCGYLGFEVGQRVELTAETFTPLMHGMHMYALVIANRYLDTIGADRVLTECHGYEGVLAEGVPRRLTRRQS